MQRSVIATPAFAALLLVALSAGEAHAADRVGVAAAVTPQATSQPPGGDTRTLKIGKAVVYNERIDTSDTGVVQVLLLDGSTFTVGPKSSLVIDKFVYNPNTGTGELAASFGKGALRFVGGKLSKGERGVTVKTPAGTLTVRGGIFQGLVQSGNQAVFAFVFGRDLSLARGGKRYTLRHAGNLFYIGGPGKPVMRATTQADTEIILAAVSGKTIQVGGKVYKVKGGAWPFYYGIQPAGKYPDQPFIRELYYDGAFVPKLTRVPDPVPRIVKVPDVVDKKPVVDHRPPPPPPPPPPNTPNNPTRPPLTHIP
ncbi:MAG: FecR family protein [Methyloceanibacter sp.]|uniref:FecR family protein n=1 Tax=Methyloceanibacter sp. TaxID=1965321 RepID=UPI003D6D5D2C